MRSDLFAVVLNYAVKYFHLMLGGWRLHSLGSLGLLIHFLLEMKLRRAHLGAVASTVCTAANGFVW